MRKVLRCWLVLGAAGVLCAATAERMSWNRVQYIGGTLAIRTSPYDWNTVVTVKLNPDTIVLAIAPASVFGHQITVRLKASQITSLVCGPVAWQRVADVIGAHMPSKRPSLFGLLTDYALVGILYQGDDGKPGAILLSSTYSSAQMASVLASVSGKPAEYGK